MRNRVGHSVERRRPEGLGKASPEVQQIPRGARRTGDPEGIYSCDDFVQSKVASTKDVELAETLGGVFDQTHGYRHDVQLQDREEEYWLYVARVPSTA